MNMGQASKRTLVRCKSCGKEWLKNTYTIQQWSGLCKNCALKGKPISAEHRARRMGARTGWRHSEESKRKMALMRLGTKRSDATKEKMRLASTGRRHTEETRARMCAIQKIIGPLRGYHHSLETRERMSRANVGKKVSIETRKKLSDLATGRYPSATTRMKMSAAKKRKPIASWITEKAHVAWRGQHHTEDWKRVQAEKKKGSRNPNWNNGSSLEPYGLSFDEQLREAIRERDNRACRICGEKENGRRLAIHHIDYNKNNDEFTNLLSLCAPCHAATNQKRKYWQTKFSSEINNVQ
jgi:hypothetical protein